MRKKRLLINLILILLFAFYGIAEGEIHPIVKQCRNAAKLKAVAEGKSINELKRAISSDPENPFLFFNLAVEYWYQEEWDLMSSNFQKAYDLAGEDIGKHLVLLQLFHDYEYDDWIKEEQETIVQLSLNTGGSDIPVVPYAAMKMGYDALEDDNRDRAEEDFIFATRVNPSLLQAYTSLIKVYLSKLDAKSSRATGVISSAFNSILNYTENQFLVLYNIYYLIIGSIFLTLLAYALILSVKYLRHTYHRIVESFHRGMPKTLRNILSGLAIAIPVIIFLRFDDLIMLATWLSLLGIAATWLYMKKPEKILVIIYIAFLVLNSPIFSNLPPLATPFTQFGSLLAVPLDYSSPISAIIKAQNSPYDPKLEEDINDFLEKDSFNKELLFSRALLNKRGGNFDQAEQTYLQLIERYKYDRDLSSYFYNNLGNIYFIQERYSEAEEMYRSASERNKNLAQPYYNLSTLLLEAGQFNVGPSAEARKKASDLNRELVNQFIVNATPHYNRETMDIILQHDYLWRLALSNFSEGNRNLVSGFWTKGIKGNYNILGTAISLGLVLIIFVLVLQQKNLGLDNIECDVCTKSICKKCRKTLKEQVICPDCYQALSGIRRVAMQDHLREKLERKADAKIRRNTGFYSLIPGGGFVYRNFFVRGFTFIFITFILIALWRNYGVFITPIPHLKYEASQNLAKNIVFGVIGLIYWIVIMQASKRAKHKVKAEEPVAEPEPEDFLEEEY